MCQNRSPTFFSSKHTFFLLNIQFDVFSVLGEGSRFSFRPAVRASSGNNITFCFRIFPPIVDDQILINEITRVYFRANTKSKEALWGLL